MEVSVVKHTIEVTDTTVSWGETEDRRVAGLLFSVAWSRCVRRHGGELEYTVLADGKCDVDRRRPVRLLRNDEEGGESRIWSSEKGESTAIWSRLIAQISVHESPPRGTAT